MAEETAADIEVEIQDAPSTADAKAKAAQVALELTPSEPPKPEPAPKKEAKRKIIQPEEGLEKLQQQLEAERREKEQAQQARQAAEARATEAAAQAARAQGQAQDSELTTVMTGLAHVKQMREALRAKFAAASAAADHNAMAEIQDEMAETAANQKMFERAEQELKNRPKPQPVMPDDPVEKLAANMAPQSAAWIRAHPDYATGEKYQEMVAAHQMALARHLSPNTPAYFDFVERKLDLAEEPGLVEVATHVDTTPQRATGGRSTPAAAAPVSRSGTGNGSRPKSYTLTPAQQEGARISGVTNQEYALEQMRIDEEKRSMN